MEHFDNVGTIETEAQHDRHVPEGSGGQTDITPTGILRIKEQMFNQCFEMAAQLNAAKEKMSCSTAEAEIVLSNSELEDAKTDQFNKTLSLHRMQMWHAIAEKLKQNDPESNAVKAVCDRCMALCSQINQLQQESRDIANQVIDTQKKSLELKRLTQEKMKEIDELMDKKDHPEMEKYKDALQKGQSNLEKYKKMTAMTQNVFRGILLACKVNWLDDPKIKAIALTLEDVPISD